MGETLNTLYANDTVFRVESREDLQQIVNDFVKINMINQIEINVGYCFIVC